ncbi:tetratricopeptide repeat protein [Candidatus Woesearchaeota archaeon]|nr:tetratricopeptide repeat protein [Candidatus Woesearchaeota archaeon]
MNKKAITSVLLIILISLISYYNIFDNEFVWDDHLFILDNQDIRSFSNLPLFFAQDAEGLYRPLRSLHYTLVYSIAGKNEFLYHFNSLFFHAAISILIFFIIFGIIGNKNISLVSALIFAAHPIHTERVTNITGGFDLSGIFFMLLSFFLYIKYSKSSHNDKKYFFASLILFILALFASEEAITLPLIIILYEFCFNREKFNKKLIKNCIPFFAAAAFYVFLRFSVLGIAGRQEQYLAGSFFLTQITMLKAYVYYIYLLVFPLNLTLYHNTEPVVSVFDPKAFLSLFLILAIFLLAIKYYKNKVLFFSIFWFFITLIPFSNMIPIQNFIAERYLYLPSVAFALLLSYSLFSLYNLKLKAIRKNKILKNAIIVFIVLLLALYVVKTIDRNKDWQDNLTLWEKTAAANPENSRAHDNLGFTYEQMGENNKALAEFEASVMLMPDNYKALANLGVIYAKLGRYNESISVLKKSIKISEYYKTYDKLGLVYVELKDYGNAVESFKKAIEANTRYAKAHNDLGTVYGKQGKFDLALQEFNEAIRIDRDYADAHYNLGILLDFMGQKELAKKEFERAYSLEPENGLYRKKAS